MIHKIIFATILILSGNQIFSQDSIKGRLIDYETNQTLPGVTIMDGNNFRNGIISDRDGNFKLKVEGDKRNLEIYFVGYYPIKFITIPKEDKTIDFKEIKLVPNHLLDDAVVGKQEQDKKLRMNVLREYRIEILGKKLKPDFVRPPFEPQYLLFYFNENENK